MKRFSQLISMLPDPLKPAFLPVGLDLGSSTTRIRVGDALRLRQQTCTVTYGQEGAVVALGAQAARYQPGLHQHTYFRAPVRGGVVTDISLTTDYLRVLFNEVLRPGELTLLTQISGTCLIPSQSSKVEKYIFQKMFDRFGEGQWQLVPKASVWQKILQKQKTKLAGCIDLGGDTTEVVLLDGSGVLAETIPFGGRQLVKRLLQLVRAEYGFQLSWESAEALLKELDLRLLQNSKKVVSSTVRGKNMTNGKPETVSISSEVLSTVIRSFYDELLAFIQLFFAQVPATLMTKSLDTGLLLSGGLSQVTGTEDYFNSVLTTHCVVSKSPQEDLIRNLW